MKYHVNGTTRKSIPGLGLDAIKSGFLVIYHSRVFFILHTHTTLFCVKFFSITAMTLVITERTMHSLLFFIGPYLHL